MPSISTANSAYKPYQTKVVEAPLMGSFADMWGVRQESDIILEDGMKKSGNAFVPLSNDELENLHTVRVTKHNPYSLTQPVTQVYSCRCSQCLNEVHDIDAHYAVEDIVEIAPKFMPPPPPRVDTYDVIAACGAIDPDTIVYTMMMRWYAKVSQIQCFFDPSAPCPAPSPSEYNFVEWCTLVNEWWYKNFEHRQKKQSRNHNGQW